MNTQETNRGPEPWPINHLPSISERLRTQDNQCTAEPMFCVQVKRREYGYMPEYCDETIWIDQLNDCDEIPVPENPTDGQIETGFKDIWETVMVAFTEAGAQDYIRQNGHNHRGEKRIYVESFRRCEEMVAIRAFLRENPAAEIAALRTDKRDLYQSLMALTTDVIKVSELDAAANGDYWTTNNIVTITKALITQRDNARNDAAALREQNAKLLEALGMSTPFPATECLVILSDAVTHLLEGHSCDAQGHEKWMLARDTALRIVVDLRAAIAKAEGGAES